MITNNPVAQPVDEGGALDHIDGFAFTKLRDLDSRPYTPDELRVCEYLRGRMPDIGCGDDPIGYLIAAHAWIIHERNQLRATSPADIREKAERAGLRIRDELWPEFQMTVAAAERLADIITAEFTKP